MTLAAGQGSETERLKQIGNFILDTGIEGSVILDPSITRGLDYYTGVVFESFLADLPGIGSVCSGGRYDNLVGLYTADQRAALCGVGASIGIDRLIAGLEAIGRLKEEKSYAKTAVAWVSPGTGGACQALADELRREGIPCEVFLNEEKLTRQFQISEKKGLSWLVIPSSEKPLESPLTLRNLSKRENREGLGIEEVVEILKES
jgi:histidyl-tRNA synthetase